MIKELTQKKTNKLKEKEYTFLEHLEELRRRIIICIIFIFGFSFISFLNVHKIWKVLALSVGKLIFIKPTEAFMVDIKLSFFTGVFLAFPIILFQIWRFIEPAIENQNKIMFGILIFFSYILFIFGTLFSFFIILPVTIKFLLNYAGNLLEPLISANEYLSFLIFFIFGFGIVFQLPIVVLLLTKTGLVSVDWFINKRKFVIFIVFIIAAIITPGPDIFSQIMVAIPTIILFEISILISKILSVKKEHVQEDRI